MSERAQEHIPALTSLRFFAALAVVAHHTAGFEPGYGGVSLFFVLSGYVLTLSYRDRMDGVASWWAFWRGRMKRIMPTHLWCLLLAIPLGIPTAGALIANALLLQSWSPDPLVHNSLNAVAWSLSVEAFFYLCFPFVCRAGWRAAGGALAVLAFVAISFQITGVSAATQHALFYINPLARLPEFIVGIALANAAISARTTVLSLVGVWAVTLLAVWLLPPSTLSQALAFVPASIMTISHAAANRTWLAHPVLVRAGQSSFLLYMVGHLVQRYMIAFFGLSYAVNAASALIAIVAAYLFYDLSLPTSIKGVLRQRYSRAL